MDDFEGVNTSMEEVTAGVVDIVRKLELEVECEDGIESLWSFIIKIEWMRSCFLDMSKESGFLRWKLLLVKMLWILLKWQEKI